jgi:uncharacterized membrane protein
MKRWIGPAIAAVFAGGIAWYGTMIAIPRVIMSVATDGMAKRGAFNAMSHGKLATPENQPIVRPSPDLAYSSCAFDVSKGPVQVDVVPVAGRYSSLSIFDARTDVVFVRNDMQAGGKPYRVVIARPGQAVPAGAEVVRVDQNKGIALIRLLLANPAEIDGMEAVRRLNACRVL